MAAPRQAINKATLSVGFVAKLVTVTAITSDGQAAITVDRQNTETRVPLLVQRSKGPLPQVGERWLIDQDLGFWAFAAYVGKASSDFAGSGQAPATIVVSATPPANPVTGALWMDSSLGNELFRWNGSAWAGAQLGTQALADGAVTAAKIASGTITAAQIAPGAGITAGQVSFSVADIGGTRVFTGTSQPSGASPGDIWIDEAHDNRVSIWDGHTWTLAQYGTAAIRAGSITADLIEAGTITADLIAAGTVIAGAVDGTTITGAQIIADGASGQLLIYDGDPALGGNLIGSWSGAAGQDAYGHTYPVGLSASQGLFSGTISAASISGTPVGGSTVTGSDIQGGTIAETSVTFDQAGGRLLVYATVTSTQTISSGSGSWTAPAGLIGGIVKAQCWAAGSGGDYGGLGRSGYGGSGGEFAAENSLAVTPGSSYAYSVGAAGAAGSSGQGGNGGDTTFAGDAVTVTAHGGGHAKGGTGSTNSLHFDGGVGGHVLAVPGSGAAGGGGAGSAGSGHYGASTNGGTSGGVGGAGGSPDGGAGGHGGSNAPNPGVAGTAPGGGGGMGGFPSPFLGAGSSGAAGASGQIVLTWTTTRTLVCSIAPAAGTDSLGNSYPEGGKFDNLEVATQLKLDSAATMVSSGGDRLIDALGSTDFSASATLRDAASSFAAISSTVVQAHYYRLGRLIWFAFDVTANAAATQVAIALPVTAAYRATICGAGGIYGTSAPAETYNLGMTSDLAHAVVVNSAFSFQAIATGQAMRGHVLYEAAS